MNDVVVEVVGQQWLRQLTQKTLQYRRRNMNVAELVKVDWDSCNRTFHHSQSLSVESTQTICYGHALAQYIDHMLEKNVAPNCHYRLPALLSQLVTNKIK